MISDQIGEGHINLVNHSKMKQILYDVLTDARSIESTLGPAGKVNLLNDSLAVDAGGLYPSRDGFRLISNFHYDDPFYDMIHRIIRDVSTHSNITVGDGTTSGIVILDEFYKDLTKYYEHATIIDGLTYKDPEIFDVFKKISRYGVTQALEGLYSVIKNLLIEKGYIKFLKDLKDHEEKKKIITQVATIAANNDKTVGEFVANIFDKVLETEDELFVEISPNSTKDFDEYTEIGFRLPGGYINKVYATERDGRTAKYDDPRFLLIQGPLIDQDISTLLPVIEYVCITNDKPLVIVADDYSIKLSQWLYSLRIGAQRIDPETKQMHIMQPLKILPIYHPSDNDYGKERAEDLSIALGGKLIPLQTETLQIPLDTPIQIETILGRAKRITAIGHDTSIVGGFGSKDLIDTRIEELTNNMNHMVLNDSSRAQLEVADIRDRIGMLKSTMCVLHVGGVSYKERQYNTLVYEDAVYAVKATIKNGFTLAGQVSINHLILKSTNEIIAKTVENLSKMGKNVVFGSKKEGEKEALIGALLLVVDGSFKAAYAKALENAIVDQKTLQDVFSTLYSEDNKNAISYNLITDTYETLHSESSMLVAGNTDYETLRGVFDVTKPFFNAGYLQTLYVPRYKRGTEESVYKPKT